MIRGNYTCVCFTESPIAQLGLSLADRETNSFKYRALGLMVDKEWAYARGARPAIYQSDEEYDLLPEELKYRHVRYEPPNKIDFTWEREWRLRTDYLDFSPEDVTLIVPQRRWADALADFHTEKFRETVSRSGPGAITRYPWHLAALSDLGIDVPDDL